MSFTCTRNVRFSTLPYTLVHSLIFHSISIYGYTDLEWKVIYVSSAENATLDQTLDEILVGPVPVGVNKFIFEVEAPNIQIIPEKDILGVTVILVTVSYREKEFIRVGYYVNNEYTDEYDPEIGPPKPLDMDKVIRTILADKPRVTKFPIPWGNNSDSNAMDVGEGEMMMNSEMIHDNDEGQLMGGNPNGIENGFTQQGGGGELDSFVPME